MFVVNFIYFQNLNNLLENYLEPLKRETFLSNAEINALFGNIQEIVKFQRQFLQNLDHAIEIEAEFNNFEHPSQFKVKNNFFFFLTFMIIFFYLVEINISKLFGIKKSLQNCLKINKIYKKPCSKNIAYYFQNVLFSIGRAFLYYVNHFKLYSSFCASHSKAQKVLHPSKLIITLRKSCVTKVFF